MPDTNRNDDVLFDDTGLFVEPDMADSLDADGYEPRIYAPQQEHNVEDDNVAPSKGAIVGGVVSIVAAVASVCLLAFALFAPAANTTSAYYALVTEEAQVHQSNVKTFAEPMVPLYVPYMDEKGSRIPVRVQEVGADSEQSDFDEYYYESDYDAEGGEGVNVDDIPEDEIAFLTYDGKGLELQPGTYEVTVLGSPVSDEGIVYKIPTESASITVSDDYRVTYNSGDVLSFSVIPAVDVTEEDINAAIEWIWRDPKWAHSGGSFAEKAWTRRNTAVEEAQKRQEAERAAAAALAATKEKTETNQTTETQQTTNDAQRSNESTEFSFNDNSDSTDQYVDTIDDTTPTDTTGGDNVGNQDTTPVDTGDDSGFQDTSDVSVPETPAEPVADVASPDTESAATES